MVLLNGKMVDENVIDPAKHKYIGRFRPATNWMAGATCNVYCDCGEVLQYRQQCNEHYNNGCCDINQYVDL